MISSGAIIVAGEDINVIAHEYVDFNSAVGTVAGGIGALGAAVAVNSLATNATAKAGGTLSAGGDVIVTSDLHTDGDTFSFAGTGGVVALELPWLCSMIHPWSALTSTTESCY